MRGGSGPPSGPALAPGPAAWAAAVIAIAALACALRLHGLDEFRVYGDTVYPYNDALRMLQGDYLLSSGRGTTFRYGWLDHYLLVPLVAVAGGLRHLVASNAVVQALATVPIALAGRRLAGCGAGLLAASAVAVWPVLVEQPFWGFYTYRAPVYVALAAWAASHALRRPGLGASCALAAALAAATMSHPYALAPAVGAAVLVPRLVRVQGARLVVAAALGALLVAPTVHGNFMLHAFGESGLSPGQVFARPPDWREGTLPELVRWALAQAAHRSPIWARVQEWVVVLLLFGLMLPGRAGRALRPGEPAWRWVTAWAVASVLCLLGLAGVVGYLRGYHLAVVVPLVALGASGLLADLASRGAAALWRPAGPAAAGALVLVVLGLGVGEFQRSLLQHRPRSPEVGFLATTERLARAIAADAGDAPRAMAMLTEPPGHGAGQLPGARPLGSLMAMYLEQRLSGVPERLFPLLPPEDGAWPRAYVVADVHDESWAVWTEHAARLLPAGAESPRVLLEEASAPGNTLRLLTFSDIQQGAAFMAAACPMVSRWPGIWNDPTLDPLDLRRMTIWAAPALVEWNAPCPARSPETLFEVEPPAPPLPTARRPVPREISPGILMEIPEGWRTRIARDHVGPGGVPCRDWLPAARDVAPGVRIHVTRWTLGPDPRLALPLFMGSWRPNPGDPRSRAMDLAAGPWCRPADRAGSLRCAAELWDPSDARAIYRQMVFTGDEVVHVELIHFGDGSAESKAETLAFGRSLRLVSPP